MIRTQQVDRPRAVDGEVIPAFQYGSLDAESARKARDAVGFINARQRTATTAILEIGECLVGVKEALGHGNFIAWLEAEFGWTDRSARNYMMAAKALPKTETVSVLPVTAMYDLARSPEPIRERIIGELEKGELRADAVRDRISEAKREAEAEKLEAKKSPAERKREQARREREQQDAIKRVALLAEREWHEREAQRRLVAFLRDKLGDNLGALVDLLNAAGLGYVEAWIDHSERFIAPPIDAAIDVIRGTVLDTDAYRYKLSKLSPSEQVFAAKRDLSWPRKSGM